MINGKIYQSNPDKKHFSVPQKHFAVPLEVIFSPFKHFSAPQKHFAAARDFLFCSLF